MNMSGDIEFEDDIDELDVAESLRSDERAAVVSGTDWTTETIVSQLVKGNILLNPRFQRRDAWKIDRKSRFIESLLVGLPIPQIVLAEAPNERGKFIVLDGKQRLLSIYQFWGMSPVDGDGFALSGLTLRPDLKKKTISELRSAPKYRQDYDALCNQAVRTVVIRDWKDTDLLHTIFLRLNTGSVKLSPQELRQALMPGPFTDWIDGFASESPSLQKLLGVDGPDSRMRDVELLARFLSFRFFVDKYPGRMKRFLDDSFAAFNSKWDFYRDKVEAACADFEKGVASLVEVFGDDLARKPDSGQFNRAVFDALIYFHSQSTVRSAVRGKKKAVAGAYRALFSPGSNFRDAIESDTAGSPNTDARLRIWGNALSKISGKKLAVPSVPLKTGGSPAKRVAAKRG